jgi:hypothetical protein
LMAKHQFDGKEIQSFIGTKTSQSTISQSGKKY